MSWKSNLNVKRRCEKSWNGETTGVLKSAIQKYARRGNLKKGSQALVELDLFRFLEYAEYAGVESILVQYVKKHKVKKPVVIRGAKTIRTNMMNRLLVMGSEDVSISEHWMPSMLWNLYSRWQSERTKEKSRIYLHQMYKIIVEAKKLRLISDLKTVFTLPPYYIDGKKQAQLLDQIMNELTPDLYQQIHPYKSKKLQKSGLFDGFTSGLHP